MILRGDCIFAARKLMDSEFLYVFAFDPESRRQNMPKIRKYIQASLQARFNREFGLNSLKKGASAAG